MKDAVATMGNILPDDAGGRDAVHVAVFSAFSHVKLFPGLEVSIIEHDERDAKVVTHGNNPVGIVDPFLSHSIEPGDRFWVYLYPRTITALSHRWSHPAFESSEILSYAPPSQKLASEQWLKTFTDHADCPGYHAVLAAAARVADGASGSHFDSAYLRFDGSDAHGEIPDEFWNHVEIVLGRPIMGKKAKYFSCSC